jgi:hypothetical protein
MVLSTVPGQTISANENFAWLPLRLEMAFKTEVRIALSEQLGIDRSMHIMTSRATLAHGFMLEHKRAGLGNVALSAKVLLIKHRCTSNQRGIFPMRIMTVAAGHFAFQHWMMILEAHLTPLIQVALKTDFR